MRWALFHSFKSHSRICYLFFKTTGHVTSKILQKILEAHIVQWITLYPRIVRKWVCNAKFTFWTTDNTRKLWRRSVKCSWCSSKRCTEYRQEPFMFLRVVGYQLALGEGRTKWTHHYRYFVGRCNLAVGIQGRWWSDTDSRTTLFVKCKPHIV